MWPILAAMLFTSSESTFTNISLFNSDQVIFTSTSNITKLLVQAGDNTFLHADSSALPTIFFTVSDPNFEGGSCIYVLEDLAAYEILEGGRDSTADYGSDGNVYFGARDGVYKYDKDTLSAKKIGPFRDSIIQIQKANNTDRIYYLTDENRLFALENNATVRTKIGVITCATQFVLDTSNSIYYIECKTNALFILERQGSLPVLVPDEFTATTLIRPAFIMDNCIPLLADGKLYILYVNGTIDPKDFCIAEKPSAFSIDTALYLVIALDGKLYEYNVMEVMLDSMYGLGNAWPQALNKIILSVIGVSKNLFGLNQSGAKSYV